MGSDNGKKRRKEAKRARQAAKQAARDAARQQRELQNQMAAQRQAMLEQTRMFTEQAAAPTATGATLGSENQGISTGRSRRKTAKGLGRGLSALRIPLNIG